MEEAIFISFTLSLPFYLCLSLFFTHRRGHSLWFASVHTYTFTLICVLTLLLMQNGNIERTFDGKRNIRATAEWRNPPRLIWLHTQRWTCWSLYPDFSEKIGILRIKYECHRIKCSMIGPPSIIPTYKDIIFTVSTLAEEDGQVSFTRV